MWNLKKSMVHVIYYTSNRKDLFQKQKENITSSSWDHSLPPCHPTSTPSEL